MTRCLGCMEEYDEALELCPYCGYIKGTPAKAQNHLAPGTMLIDRYLIGRCLGQGGFGITYIAWDSRLYQKVAIKEFMPTSLASRLTGQLDITCYNDEARDRFHNGIRRMLDESRRLARFHELESVVKVYDCFEANQTAYIIMEFLKGENFKEVLTRQKQFSLSETVTMMTPVLQALSEMHKSGLIHRDISPDNIFICKNGRVKLLDFGSARVATGSDEKSLSVILKPGYAPKEQYSAAAKQGPYTDVYAVCATIYEMLTGKKPVDSLVRNADSDELVPIGELVSLPQSVADAIMQGLAIEAKDRHQSVDPLLEAFLGKAIGEKQPKKMNKGLLFAIGGAVIAAAIAATVLFVLHGRTPEKTVPTDDMQAVLADTLPDVSGEYSEFRQKLVEQASQRQVPYELLPAFTDAAELRETLKSSETIRATDGGVLAEYRDEADNIVLSETRTLQGEGETVSAEMNAYDDSGRRTAYADYAADGTLTKAQLFFYDEDGTLFTQSDYEGETLVQRVEYLYAEDGTTESAKTFDADGNHLYSSVFSCDENGGIQTEKRYDPDGRPVYIRTVEADESEDEKWYDADGLVSRRLHREYKNDAPTKLTEYAQGEVIRKETWSYKDEQPVKHLIYGAENALSEGWRWFYDEGGALSEVRQYNADEDLVLRVLTTGAYTTYGYHAKGMVSERVVYDTHGEITETDTIYYDENDKIRSREDYDGEGNCIQRFDNYTPCEEPAGGYTCDVFNADDELTETRTYTAEDKLVRTNAFDRRGRKTAEYFYEDGECVRHNVLEYAGENLVYKEIWHGDTRTRYIDYAYDSDGSWTKQTLHDDDGTVLQWIEYRRLLGMDYRYDGNSNIPSDRSPHNPEIESFED